jgi:hypothetical protein
MTFKQMRVDILEHKILMNLENVSLHNVQMWRLAQDILEHKILVNLENVSLHNVQMWRLVHDLNALQTGVCEVYCLLGHDTL